MTQKIWLFFSANGCKKFSVFPARKGKSRKICRAKIEIFFVAKWLKSAVNTIRMRIIVGQLCVFEYTQCTSEVTERYRKFCTTCRRFSISKVVYTLYMFVPGGGFRSARNHLPFQNFSSVTSSSASSSACTLSCLGVRVMRYGSGLRDDSPLYPSRDMGSSGSDRISNAQSNREMARYSSLSATWMAGQMRRLRRIRTKGSVRKNPAMAGRKAGNTLYAPRAERPMVPVHCVGEVARFRTSQRVA
jgi:hypothetical protein